MQVFFVNVSNCQCIIRWWYHYYQRVHVEVVELLSISQYIHKAVLSSTKTCLDVIFSTSDEG
jgi:hypothetical protein